MNNPEYGKWLELICERVVYRHVLHINHRYESDKIGFVQSQNNPEKRPELTTERGSSLQACNWLHFARITPTKLT